MGFYSYKFCVASDVLGLCNVDENNIHTRSATNSLHSVFYLLYTTPTCFGRIPWPSSESYKFCRRMRCIWLLFIDNAQAILFSGAAAHRRPSSPHFWGFHIISNNASQSVGILWTSSSPRLLPDNTQHSQQTAIRPAEFDLTSLQASGRRPTPYTMQSLSPARQAIYIYIYIYIYNRTLSEYSDNYHYSMLPIYKWVIKLYFNYYMR
jgi:hypothetical protein